VLRLGKLEVKNWAQWKHGVVDLGYPGVTFVRGRNDDRAGNPNGAGKSTLFYAPTTVMLSEHPLAIRKNSLGSVTRDSTYIDLRGRRERDRFEVELKGTTTRVVLGDRELDVRKKVDAREVVQNEITCMSAELWSSMVHCVGLTGNPLIRGTSAQRCQFLEKAFDLDRWKSRHDRVGDVLGGMRRAAADLEDARKELAELPKARRVDDVVEEYERAKKVRARLSSEARELRSLVAKYDDLPERPRDAASVYDEKRAAAEKRLADLEGASEEHARWRAAKARHNEVERQRASVKRKIRTLDAVARGLEVPALEDACAGASRHAKTVAASAEDFPRVSRWYDLARKIARRHDIVFKSREELRSLSLGWVQVLRGGSSRCPVCGSKFRRAVDAREVATLAEVLDDLPDDLNVRQYEVSPEQAAAARDKKLEQLRAARSRDALREQLRSLRPVDVPARVDYDPGEAKKLAQKIAAAEEFASRARRWSGVPKDFDVSATQERLAEVEKKLEVLDSRVSTLAGEIETAKSRRAARKKARERVDALEIEVSLHPTYRALHSAYSATGMRLWLLSEMLEAIVSSLNEMASSTRERISYGYKLSRNRDLAFTASNLSGTFDVRMLSGAEAGGFVISLVTAILPLLPDKKRVSTLILDEVDANASSQTRRVIATELLPRLVEIVPSLWIVTPTQKNEYRMPGARELLVVKKNAVSSLHE